MGHAEKKCPNAKSADSACFFRTLGRMGHISNKIGGDTMGHYDFYQAFLQVTKPTIEQAAIQALQRADISPDAAYYNGAKKNVLDALNGAEKETALPFWEEYYTALIRQYKTMQTEEGRQQTAEAAKTVQAILYALRETES